jgi:hypothetical protein
MIVGIGWGMLSGCVTVAEYEQKQSTIEMLQQTVLNEQAENTALQAKLAKAERKLGYWKSCRDKEIAEFMVLAEDCDGPSCPQPSILKLLMAIIRQPHVLIRLKPQQPLQLQSLAPLRLSQLQDMLKPSDPQNPGPSQANRHVLLLTMEVGSANAKGVAPSTVASWDSLQESFIRLIRKDLNLGKDVGFLGPFPVSCKQKSQILDAYSRNVRQDKPVPQEPKSQEPQLAVWALKVDC